MLREAADPLMSALGLRPKTGQAVLDQHQQVMRGPSELSPAFRELIAAFTSAINGCPLCRAAHTRVAELLGYPPATLDALLSGPDAAPLSEREMALFAYLEKTITAPAKLSANDAERTFAAGWSELAVHDALNVCCLFCSINRFVLGHGITAGPAAIEASARKLARRGYG
ncbi:MAG: carboxymuconolactone decarboxylase family protein [Pseudomonadota bacterium]